MQSWFGKTKNISLGDYLCRSDDDVHDMVDNPNDYFCVVSHFEKVDICMPPMDSDFNVGRILRRRANDKELKIIQFLKISVCVIISVYY